MQLIVASQKKIDENNNQWSEKDMELLRTLYEEKRCPVDILATVFKRSEDEIHNKLSVLTRKE
jgi:hypothetical protein